MKLFLDTNALAYLTEISLYKSSSNKVFNYEKYQKILSENEIITDGIVVFEIFNHFPDKKEHIFNRLKKYDATFYIVTKRENHKVLNCFKKAREYGKYDKLFAELTPIVASEYATQLSVLIWHLFCYWLGLIESYNGFKNNPNYKELALKSSIILKPAELHIRKKLYKSILELISKHEFKEENVSVIYDDILEKTAHHFEQIKFEPLDEKTFTKKLNIVKDCICCDQFKNKYDDKYENFKQYQNAYSKNRVIKKNKITKNYPLNLLTDGKVTSIIRNKLLNQIEIRHNKNKNFNDIKDMLIAEHYLKYIRENSFDNKVRFVTFDNKFINSLKECKNVDIEESIKLIDSFFI